MIIPHANNITFAPSFYSHMVVVKDIVNQNFTASGTPLPSEKPEWIVDETQYQYQQTITATVHHSQNDWMVYNGDILAAFSTSICRGVSAPVETSQGKRFFLQIWSNQPDETIIFKYYNIIDQKIYTIKEKINFSPNYSMGTIRTPYEFTLSYTDILAIKDVNDDGAIDLKDVLILLNYMTGIN